MTTQPMPSAKVAPGLYHVLGTSTECVVEFESWGWWVLTSDGGVVKTFPTKREALVYCQEHPEL